MSNNRRSYSNGPVIVNGVRGAQSSEDAAAAKQADLAAAVAALSVATKAAPEDQDIVAGKKVVFESKYKDFRLQITSPEEEYLGNGKFRRPKGKIAKFTNHTYETDDPDVVKAIRNFRFYGDWVWDVENVRKAVVEATHKSILQTLQANPEVRRLVLAELEGEEFSMPAPAGA